MLNKKKLALLVLFAGVLLIVFYSANYELIGFYKKQPQGTKYFGATGFFFDYYQFLSWIRDGREGNILIRSRYIPSNEPRVLLHPFFPLIGFLTRGTSIPIDILYHLLRNLSLLFFLYALYRFIGLVFPKKKTWIGTLLLVLTTTSFPRVLIASGRLTLVPILTFWTTFYPLERFSIPAHHLLADGFFLLLLIIVFKTINADDISFESFVKAWILAIVIILLNPGQATLLVFLLLFYTIEKFAEVAQRKFSGFDKHFLRLVLLDIAVLLAIVPYGWYLGKIFTSGNPWMHYYNGEKVSRYLVSYKDYLLSLGPLFFSSLVSVFYLRKFKISEWFCFIWVLLPVLLFPYVGRQIPIAMSRLFAFNLYIPEAVLTVFFFINFRPRTTLAKLARGLLVGFIALATLGGLYVSFKDVFSFQAKNYYNVFLPDDLTAVLSFIDKEGNKNKTVIAGENISNLVPAFTNMHVVTGRRDASPNYYEMLGTIESIYLRKLKEQGIIERLESWNVQYLIFGIDQVSFEEFLKSGEIERIREARRFGSITIAEFY